VHTAFKKVLKRDRWRRSQTKSRLSERRRLYPSHNKIHARRKSAGLLLQASRPDLTMALTYETFFSFRRPISARRFVLANSAMPEVCLATATTSPEYRAERYTPRPNQKFKDFAGRRTRCGAPVIQLPSSGARRWCRTRLVDISCFAFVRAAGQDPRQVWFFLSGKGFCERSQRPQTLARNLICANSHRL
jgi:hypothetical protein